MEKAGYSRNKGNIFTRLFSVARSCRHQLGLVAVTMALGLAIILNIAMASETTTEKAHDQMAYFKTDSSKKSLAIN
ncbi:hypothetical protein [uncultured Sneathiella sp.]|jgi:hypothetical protein|uniref:hypothetical protein n=1 Tax=uncultured Sneathiella sp. TaxID=879315 RepID=UPI002591A7ED|nr:hypothetical protein [uncultured Sneathiella sp.]